MRLGGNRERRNISGRLRRGQVITTHGCGAIVDLPSESAIIAGTDFWTNHTDPECILTEENLQRFLGVDYFVTPPEYEEENHGYSHALPSFRFPTWLFCPVCKRLAHEDVFNFTEHPRCGRCDKPLVPSRFVIACASGHLDDFPYEWWAHNRKRCSASRTPELFIRFSERSSGLGSIFIDCRSCGMSRSMAGSFGANALRGFRCSGRRPWLNGFDPAGCNEPVRTMQRGATNLHFCITTSALSIPPWSEQIQIELGKRWHTLKYLVGNREGFLGVIRGNRLPEICGCSEETIYEQARRKMGEEEGRESITWRQLLEGEFQALTSGYSSDRGEFKTRLEDVPDFLNGFIGSVTLVLRLREVMALRGFKRIDPSYDIDDRTSFQMLSSSPMDWLPAVELKGEGLFLSLDSKRVHDWESRPEVIERYRRMAAEGNWILRGQAFSPRYILLHTLSHLLIRQLILQCGYASAALKERIYCRFSDEENALDMAGVLIYTSANDSEGSLGGLVREGHPDRLENTFRQMLEDATWCSADPLCIQSEGQGLRALNLAACYSCTLLPETSCEARNCLLDRASITGTLDKGSTGYFKPLLQ